MKKHVSCPICKSIKVFALKDDIVKVTTKRFHCNECNCWFTIKAFTTVKKHLIYTEKILYKNKVNNI